MARPKLFRTDKFSYHVTARSNNRERFYLPLGECWYIFGTCLAATAEKYGIEIHAFVLMDNHFHLLLTTPHQNLDRSMRYFLSGVARWIQSKAQRINHVFGTRYRWSYLEGASSLAYVYKYIYRNPVRAGIRERVQNYRFSTINALPTPIPLCEGFDSYWQFIPRDFDERLRWLNSPTLKEAENLITTALRRYRFELTTASNAQKHVRSLKQSYGVGGVI